MRRLAALAFAAFLALPTATGNSALEPRGGEKRAVTALELVVFEANGCTYCDVFRRNVLPLYKGTTKSQQAPIRFVNLSHADESKMGLSEPIRIVPTIVLFDGGQERGRVVGYTGPENFMQLVSEMMGEPG